MQSRDKEIIKQIAAKHFPEKEHATAYIELVSAGFTSTENLESACMNAFVFLSDQIIENSLAKSSNLDPAVINIIREILHQLRDKYLTLNESNFMNFITTRGSLTQLETAIERLQQNFLKGDPAFIRDMSVFFVKSYYSHLSQHGYKEQFIAIAEAELDVFLNLPDRDLTVEHLNLLKEKIKAIDLWYAFPKKWEGALDEVRLLFSRKGKIIKILDDEINRIYNTKNVVDAKIKIDLLLGAILVVDRAKNTNQIEDILNELEWLHAFAPDKNHLKTLGLFAGTSPPKDSSGPKPDINNKMK